MLQVIIIFNIVGLGLCRVTANKTSEPAASREDSGLVFSKWCSAQRIEPHWLGVPPPPQV